MTDMKQFGRGETVLIEAQIVHTNDTTRDITHQAVTVQLSDGQGLVTNVRNIKANEAEIVEESPVDEPTDDATKPVTKARRGPQSNKARTGPENDK